MLKRLLLLAGLLSLATSPINAAGTVPGFNLTPQFDTLGKVAPGCKLYVIQAGTTSTPQNAYQDTGLSILQTNPIVCDSTGRLPQWFVADGTIKLRLTDKNGLQLFVGDNLLVVGPSSGGGGGGGTVDPTTILATGDMKLVYNTGVLTGFVRCNGRTIGSATSGASERANADTAALFAFLWTADANLAVSGGRGVSAVADFAANKTIALPDWRGRTIAGLDDMGNSAAGVLTNASTGFGAQGGNPTQLGNGGGAQSVTLTLTQLPTGITATGSGSASVSMTGGFTLPAITSGWSNLGAGTGSFQSIQFNGAQSVQNITTIFGTATGITTTSNNTGAGAHATVTPTRLLTIYLKL